MTKPMKWAKKWPGDFSIKFRNQGYKPKLVAWAFWTQIRAQEQKIRSKSELRLSLEPSVNNDIFTLSISRSNRNKKQNKQRWSKISLGASYELNKLTQTSSKLFQKLCWAFWYLVTLTSKCMKRLRKFLSFSTEVKEEWMEWFKTELMSFR